MATQHYLLHQAIVINSIHKYFADNVIGSYEIIENKPEKEYSLHLADSKANLSVNKAFGILKIFFTNGKTSFAIQGNQTFSEELSNCQEFVISETELKSIQQENKCAVFRDVPSERFNDFIEYIKSESHLNVSTHAGDSKVVVRYSIAGPYQTYATITYYHNGTVMIQGLITSLLIELFNLATSLFGADDTSNPSGFLAAISSPAQVVIPESLDYHFPDRSKFAGTPYEDMILSSIRLLNSSIVVPDFSIMSTGALRALEGLIGKRLHEDRSFISITTQIGSRFSKSNSTFPIFDRVSMDTIPSPVLAQALIDSYIFYCANRHFTFHVDKTNPMASITYPDKEQALGVVEDAITHMNE